jgi:hypothetical protein
MTVVEDNSEVGSARHMAGYPLPLSLLCNRLDALLWETPFL